MDRLLRTINGKAGRVILEHMCFGREVFRCEQIKIISDDSRLGVCINGHDSYVRKDGVNLFKMNENMFVVADDFLQITIIVNKR